MWLSINLFTLLLMPPLVLNSFLPPTACTPALLLPSLNIPTAPWHLVQLKHPWKLPAAYNLEWVGTEKEEKQFTFIPSFDEYTPSLRPHCVIALPHYHCIPKLLPLPTPRIATLPWKLPNSASKNKCQSDVLCPSDDFCFVQHYLAFCFYFTLNQGFKKIQHQTYKFTCGKDSNTQYSSDENNVWETIWDGFKTYNDLCWRLLHFMVKFWS